MATYTAQFAEDAAHTTGDLGTQILTVRKDSAAALAGADGDYQPPVTDASGRLWVNASGAAVPVTDNAGSLTVDGTVTAEQATAANLNATVVGTGTFAVQADTELPAAAALANDTASPTAPAVGAFGMIRDVGDGNWDMMAAIRAAPDLAAADSGVLAVGLMAQLDDTSPTSITENQFGNVRMSSRRALLVEGVASGTNINTNVAQINGVTVLMGNGATGTGSQRVTIASDNTARS